MSTIADIEGRLLFPLAELLDPSAFPGDVTDLDRSTDDFLNSVYFTESSLQPVENGVIGRLVLVVTKELVISPFGEATGLVIGGGGGVSVFDARVHLERRPGGFRFEIGLFDVAVGLRVSPTILRPLKPGTNEVASGSLDIPLGAVSISFGTDQPIAVTWSGSPSVPRCMIGESGIIVSAGAIQWLTPASENLPPNTPPEFLGLYLDNVAVELSGLQLDSNPTFLLDYAFIGRGGFTGRIDLQNLNLTGSLAGFTFQLRDFGLTLIQNSITASSINGRLNLPFFDAPLDVDIDIALAGGFSLAISSPNGLITLTRPGVLDLTLESIKLSIDQNRVVLALAGQITPKIGAPGLDWPSFRVQELSIDSAGHVRLEGGWLDLREQYTLSLYGFQFEIAKIGFGTLDDGRRWIGFSGGLKLVDGLTAGASVEGLRILWNPSTNVTALTLNGIGVEFEIPGTVYFKGAVAMTEPAPGVVRFDGDITLSLVALQLDVEAQLVIGYDAANDYSFFAIYLGVELPAGIPLWTTGLGLYGVAGLFALQMEPDKGKRRSDGSLEFPDEAWYAIQPAQSWYHRDTVGVSDLRKWRNQEGSLALGAGVTIGTVADNGYTFAGRFLLGIVFPGPILFIEGRANLLKERASLRSEPIFRALAVLDARAGSFLVGLDAKYQFDDTGALIDIGGGAEAFFDFHNPTAWHLYLGIDEPRERRIRAEIIQRIFEANAYFMLDASRLKTGAWIGYDKDWKFGPLSIVLEAWIEGGATLSWKPVYLSGYLWLHGRIVARVFGFSFGLGADARFDAGVFDPFFVRAELSVSIDLPWPLPDAGADIVLEWGPEPNPPLLPVPLKEVSVDHLKVTTSWPLPAGELLLPNVDPDSDGFFTGTAPGAPSNTIQPPADAPVVPLDARPRLTFGRPVSDDALIGVNPSTGLSSGAGDPGWERIGDPDKNHGPAEVRSALKEIALEQWTGAQWQTVARKGPGANSPGVTTLFGSWAPIPQLPEGAPVPGSSGATANVKLWLWSRSPYDFTRRTGGMWDEWFSDAYPNYPCVDLPPDREECCGFDQLPLGPAPRGPWICPNHTELVIGWRTPPIPRIVATSQGKALCFPRGGEAAIRFSIRIKSVSIFVSSGANKETKECIDFAGTKINKWPNPWLLDGQKITVFNSEGQSLPVVTVKTWGTMAGSLGGIDAGSRTVIELDEPADAVEVTLTAFSRPAKLIALDNKNKEVAVATMAGQQKIPETIRLETTAGDLPIKMIRIDAPQNELAIHSVCRIMQPLRSLFAIARDRRGREIGRFTPKGNLIEIPGREVSDITVFANGESFCLERICWVEGLTKAERASREELLRHIMTETARWHDEGFVLKPFTNYRLKVTTSVEVRDFPYDTAFNTTRQLIQCAYFRTEGPPGLTTLSIPKGHPLDGSAVPTGPSDPPTFDSGVEDLTRYVKQTIPPTVAPAGEPPILPRPVYCGYDIGVQFNEDYVEQMYRAAGRNLGLYLYDANGMPARDSLGRLLTPPNRWGRMPSLELSASDERWLLQLDGTTCQLRVDWSAIPRAVTLASEGQVLDLNTLYEGRLVPLLAHDGFDRYSLAAAAGGTGAVLADGVNRWIVHDVGADSAPSRWIVRESGSPAARYLEQTSDVSLGAAVRGDVFPGGTFLIRAANPDLATGHPDQPTNWTDYRASIFVRSSDDDLIGLAVRFTGESGYLVYLDQQLNRRRLVRLLNGVGTLLAESQGGYLSNRDYHLSIEVTGNQLRVHLDGKPIFDLMDAEFAKGSVALFAGANAGASFTDLRIDDLRATAPVVYRFSFATSCFSDFRHHMLSYLDETWRATLPDLSIIDPAVVAAIDPQAVPLTATTEPEARAFDSLARAALGAAALQPVAEVEVTRIAATGRERAMLVRTAEPIDWSRTKLEVLRAPEEPLRPAAPSDVRIARVGFAGAGVPNDEFVTLLLLDATTLAGSRVERRTIRSAISPDLPDGEIVFEADLSTDATEAPVETNLLWQPALVDLSEFVVIPVSAMSQPAWAAGGGTIMQNAFVGRTLLPNRPPIPLRAMIIGGDTNWTDYRLSVGIMAVQSGGAGVIFRYLDSNNHYRLEFNRLRSRTTLVRCLAGAETILWTGAGSYAVGQPFELIVEVDGSRIAAKLDGIALFEVFDPALSHGKIGFLTVGGPQATFRTPRIESIRRRLADWIIEDFGPATARSIWQLAGGALKQNVDLLPVTSGVPDNAGTVLLADQPEWSDVRIDCDLTVPNGSGAGVVLRWRGPSDYYSIVIDLLASETRLVRVASGIAATLYRTNGPVDSSVRLRVEAVGTRFRIWFDGGLAGEVYDSTHRAGLAGLLAVRGNTALWRRFSVAHAEPSWEPWFTIPDEPVRASGALVTILSGKEGEPAPALSAGEKRIFAGTEASAFKPAFPARGIDLRIVDQNGKVGHISRFLPDSAFSLVGSARIVRAEDGTGFVILAPDGAGGSLLAPGQYRLSFTFRRDNRAYDPSSLILSQQGETANEVVHLNVPWTVRK